MLMYIAGKASGCFSIEFASDSPSNRRPRISERMLWKE